MGRRQGFPRGRPRQGRSGSEDLGELPTIHRRLQLLGALVAVALLSTGWPVEEAARAADRSIQALLNRRAEAVRERDREAFADTLDDRDSSFGQAQLALFDHLGTVDLAAYSADVNEDAFGDLARPSDIARYPGAERVTIPYTQESYRLAGYDRRAVFGDMYYTFVRRDGRWRIASDSDLDDLGFFSQRNLWDFEPVTSVASEHFLALAPRCCAPDLEEILASAERAFDVVTAHWGEPWVKRVPLVLPASSEDLSRIVQATYPVENYIAFSFWTGGAGGSPGARIIMNPDRFVGDGSERANEILTHELFHIATLPSSGEFIPNWLDEGFAQYVQYANKPSVIASFDAAVAGTGDARIPENYEFFVGDATGVYRNYQRSLSLSAYIVERWGLGKMQRFYTRLGDARSPGLRAFHVDRTARRVLGMSLESLRSAWASSIGL